jgi:membrane fusion protein (multidrug efflux system)
MRFSTHFAGACSQNRDASLRRARDAMAAVLGMGAVRSFTLGLCLWGVMGCSNPNDESVATAKPPEKRAITVEVVTLISETLTIEVALTGQLEAEFEVVARTEISGVIRSIEFVEGQPVQKGDVLFRLNDREQRARLQEVEAQRKLRQDIYDRTHSLATRDISSVAIQAEAVAALAEAEARLELARLELDRTRIRAPFDGVAGGLRVGPGEWVEPDIGLVEISAIDKLQLLFSIPETSIALARAGGQIHVRVVSFPGERFAGQVFYLSPTVDRLTRRMLLKAWVPNLDHRLKPGMFANVDVVVAIKEAALMVPEAAMVYDRNGSYVWRVDAEDLAQKVPVQIGFRQAGRVEILSGLQPLDRIISAGINKVRAGDLIDAVDPPGHHGTAIGARNEFGQSSEVEV